MWYIWKSIALINWKRANIGWRQQWRLQPTHDELRICRTSKGLINFYNISRRSFFPFSPFYTPLFVILLSCLSSNFFFHHFFDFCFATIETKCCLFICVCVWILLGHGLRYMCKPDNIYSSLSHSLWPTYQKFWCQKKCAGTNSFKINK